MDNLLLLGILASLVSFGYFMARSMRKEAWPVIGCFLSLVVASFLGSQRAPTASVTYDEIDRFVRTTLTFSTFAAGFFLGSPAVTPSRTRKFVFFLSAAVIGYMYLVIAA